jgi:hypothetical protein
VPVSTPLLVYDLDLLVDYLIGEAVDGDVYPVTLLAFDNEIILEACCVWFIATNENKMSYRYRERVLLEVKLV